MATAPVYFHITVASEVVLRLFGGLSGRPPAERADPGMACLTLWPLHSLTKSLQQETGLLTIVNSVWDNREFGFDIVCSHSFFLPF